MWTLSCMVQKLRGGPSTCRVARGSRARRTHFTTSGIGVDYGYLWQRTGKEPEDEAEDTYPSGDAIVSNPQLCGSESRDRRISMHPLLHKGNPGMKENYELTFLHSEILSGGCLRQIIRSEGEAPREARDIAACYTPGSTAAGMEDIREQVSKGHWAQGPEGQRRTCRRPRQGRIAVRQRFCQMELRALEVAGVDTSARRPWDAARASCRAPGANDYVTGTPDGVVRSGRQRAWSVGTPGQLVEAVGREEPWDLARSIGGLSR